MADPPSPPSFREFVQLVRSARYEDFRARPGAKVESAEAFEQMRRHVLYVYQGVETPHSFIESGGLIVDCIPIEQHPSVRGSDGRMLSPPPLPQLPPSYGAPPPFASRPIETARPQLHPDYKDRFGNQMSCPAGTIPMIRVTLEQLSRFRNLQHFFRKAPPGSAPPGAGLDTHAAALGFPKRYALALQTIDNIGGSSYINVWSPFVGATQAAYAQQWYVATQDTTLQTVECGWHVDLARHGDTTPRLFVYWTPDTYTTGTYNTDGGNFQPNAGSTVLLGGALPSSQPNGSQTEYLMGFFLTGGAWWFYFNGQWVGNYPLSLFANGPLASNAQTAEFGGETETGFSLWPPMGSGAFAADGFSKAAYQRNVFVTPVGGAAQAANLTPSPSAGQCYTVFLRNSSGTTWDTYLFFGGPGGTNC
jgi:hypothetical protein